MPEQAPIVALRAGNRRGTAIWSCLRKRWRLNFLLTRILRWNYEAFAYERKPDWRWKDWAGVCGTSFHSPKWM